MNKEKVGSFYDVVWTEYIPEYDASEKHWLLFFTPEEVKGNAVLDPGAARGSSPSSSPRTGPDRSRASTSAPEAWARPRA